MNLKKKKYKKRTKNLILMKVAPTMKLIINFHYGER